MADGRYHQIIKYKDGKIISKETSCKGWLGTCTISSQSVTSNESFSTNPTIIDNLDSPAYKINTEYINTERGLFLAINKQKYPDDSRRFFDERIKIFTSSITIDNKEILDELKVSKPIIIDGKYEVLSNETYDYIILN
ncbi:hypothetical protein [Psychroflexus halocasei]|uniref:Uncharacterized protein n=1 Tax=Psychroflexus halocasei TaxID=908615 RepID=A0A1H3ZRW6_9FLAO|nr:hypothetical protein [Psychroflexus halocasei]SEA26141.1 hypothetical protein SAMN05421540_104180 [Psychroflexus halocasei]